MILFEGQSLVDLFILEYICGLQVTYPQNVEPKMRGAQSVRGLQGRLQEMMYPENGRSQHVSINICPKGGRGCQ